jgi:hypothetical protein
MYCGGGHLGFPIGIKNRNFVEDLPMIIPLKPLGQLKPNCPGMIIGRSSTNFMFFMPIGNARWPPPQYIEWFQRRSVLKHFSHRVQCKTKFCCSRHFEFHIRTKKVKFGWLPPQVIVITQDHMGKIQKYILL